MNLTEAQGKAVFRQYHIRVPTGMEIHSSKEVSKALRAITTKKVVVKAQIPGGSRGKAGGIVAAYTDKKNAVEYAAETLFASTINGSKVESVLLEEMANIKQEMYLAVTIDRATKGYVLVFSKKGGVDIEEAVKESPKNVVKVPFATLTPAALNRALTKAPEKTKIVGIAKQLFRLMQERDAMLVEINPLAVVKGKNGKKSVVALDAKIVIDDNALFRQQWAGEEKGLTPIELEAKKHGLYYVEMDGTIAVIGNGAGMVMATLDMIAERGGKAANFLDIRGGTGEKVMEKALGVCLMKSGVKGVLINIFAGITHCDEIAKGIADYCKKKKVRIPIVVRMIGTNQKEGRRILEKLGIHALDGTEEAAKKVVELVKQGERKR